MNNIIQNITGMANMTEQIIASDLLLAAKTGIKTYAQAISESATPNVRAILKKHLDAAILTHEQVTNYMIKKEYYFPYDLQTQIDNDLQAIDTLMNIQ